MNQEQENNGQSTRANALTPGTPMRAALSSRGDKDFFSFSAAGAGVLSVALDLPSNDPYWSFFTLEVYSPAGTLLGALSSGRDQTLSLGLPEAGTYHLAMSAAGFYDGRSYSVLASLSAGGNSGYESESNDSRASADALTLGAVMRGQLAWHGDRDVYRLSADTAGSLTVALDVPTADAFWSFFTLDLYSEAGALLSSLASGRDQTHKLNLAGAGTYYLAVSSGVFHDAGSYSLQASLQASSGGSAHTQESESNDSRASADALTLGTAMQGQLAWRGDKDYFGFSAAAAGVLTLDFDAPTESFLETFELQLLDAQGRQLASYGIGGDETLQIGLPQGGSYFVAVGAARWLHDKGSYSLTARMGSGALATEQEPNDKIANPIFDSQPISGRIAQWQDKDLFVYSAAEASSLSVHLDLPGNASLFDLYTLSVLTSSGQLLASRQTGADLTLTVQAPKAGDYIVSVRSASPMVSSGNYSLSVSAQAQTQARESEANDSLASADPIALRQPITGQLASRSDTDIYQLALSGSGTLQLSFDSPSQSSWNKTFRIDVLDAAGQLLLRRESGSDAAWSVKAHAAGTYYVRVGSIGAFHEDGDYRLTVSAQLEAPIADGAIVGSRLGDRLQGTGADDLIYGLGGNDTIDGGAGSDTVVVRAADSNLSVQSILGLSSVRGNYAAGEHAYSVSRLWNVELLRTSSGDIALEVAAIGPRLGTTGNDSLIGSAADDLIDGLGGRDFIDGGAGADTLAVFGARQQFNVLTVAGITELQGLDGSDEYAGVTSTLVHVETLAFTQGATLSLPTDAVRKVFGSSAADRLIGSDEDETFLGRGGKDTIDGAGGQDTLALFARSDEFGVTLPTADDPRLILTGKGNQSGVQIVALHIEQVAFVDQLLAIEIPAGLISRLSQQFVAEGGASAELWLSLASAPTAQVTVSLHGGDQLASSAASVSFAPDNWQTPQKVVISAIDDSLAELQHSAVLTLSSASDDARYAALAPQTLSLSIADNEAPLLGRIGGRLWSDQDQDGQPDASEQPLVGWRVWIDADSNGLWSGSEPSVLSDSAGQYWLGDLPAGSYTVAAAPGSGWVPTYPIASSSSSTLVSNVASDQSLSAGPPLAGASLTLEQAQSSYSSLGLATGMAQLRTDPRFADLLGQGQSVVVLDTGIDPNHPAFGADADGNGIADRIVYQYDFVGSNDDNAYDGQGHGTHVAGIIASSDSRYSGIAPGANLIVLKVLDDAGRGSAYDIQEAMNWVVSNARQYNIAAVNLSLGDGSFYTSAARGYLSSQIQALTNSGVMVVAAAGNDYHLSSRQGIAYPAADPYALSVGAVWAGAGQYGNWQTGSTDAIAFFSQRDDTELDIFAPGVYITSADAEGSYVAQSGTSMATPEVTGMLVLAQQLAERELGRRLSFDEIRSLLKSTGDTINDGDDERDTVTNTGLNFKRIDMMALAEAIMAMKPAISHTLVLAAGEIAGERNFGFAPTITLQGLASDDVMVGSQYGEALLGGAGADLVDGGDGDDELYGEGGDDRLTGGAGSDRFVFSPDDDGHDTIADLQTDDVIDWPGLQWSGQVSPGQGQDLLAGQVQMDVVDGTTVLYLGTDEMPGADQQLTLQGRFSASQFSLSGSQIGLLELDTTAPTVQFSDNQSGTLNRTTPTIVYTLTFSEAVTGLDRSDFTVTNGAVNTVTGSGSSWSVTVGIYDGVQGKVGLTLKADAVSDAAGNKNLASSDSNQAIDTLFPKALTVTAPGSASLLDPRVRFDTTVGSFTLELEPDLAPISTANLLSYVSKGFYTNTLFHRIVNDAEPGMQIVQGGGLTAGMVNKATDSAIALESDNGLSNLAGTVAMARTSSPNTATSQFYINILDNTFLDYQSQNNPGYAVLGKVVAGMDVLQSMVQRPVKSVSGYTNVPVTDIVINQASVVQEASTVYSRTGELAVGQIESGAAWGYSVNGGTSWVTTTGSKITLPEGSYAAGKIQVVQLDAAGNYSNAAMYGRAFVVDKTAPQVQSISPADGAVGFARDGNIVLTLSEAIALGSGTLALKTPGGTVLASYTAASPQLSVAGNTLTINPTEDLSPGTSYVLEWTSGAITDLAGNPAAAGQGHDFTTAGTAIGPRFWNNPQLAPPGTTAQAKAAVDLSDAIAVLKLIVGLPINANGSAVKAAQALAADFDQDRQIGLNDAIGILKHLVDLPGAPQPSWKYHEASKLPTSLSTPQLTEHSSWVPAALPAGEIGTAVGIVGVLTGDVDGSWVG
jgi:subtilisin family serine protease/cyclophilin family peptidyl-prolyl cis-trans isomerase